MARDPSPDFNTMPEYTIESVDYNMFYKPETKNVSSGLKELSKSLASIVPSLTNYTITEEIKASEKEKAKAVADYNSNKNSFKELVKSGKIPEGANPHYFNKMMELDLNNKARKFKVEFDTFASQNNLAQNLTPDAWNEAYETKMKEFFERENIGNYDQVAQSKAFFKVTSAFRTEREQQFMAERMSFIKKNTESNAIKNYSGLFIEAQNDDLDMESLFAKIKSETGEFINLGTAPERANDLFLAGFKKYLDVLNDEEGFDYARKVLNGFSNLKLGTGFFAGEKGGRRNETIRNDMINQLNAKEYDFLTGKKKLKDVKEDVKKQNLSDAYFKEFNKPDFSLSSFLNTYTENENGEQVPLYSPQDQAFIRGLDIALNKSLNVATSSIDAIIELSTLEDKNPYAVKEKALELARDNKLSNSDFKFYFGSTNRQLTTKRDIFFVQSSPYQTYQKLFSDKNLASNPSLAIELPLIKNRFNEDMLKWHLENQGNPEFENKPRAYQKAFDAEVKSLFGDILADSAIVQGQYDTLATEILNKYGIFIPRRGNAIIPE